MAEVLGDNERRDLYRKMLNDAVTSESTRKYSFKDFEKKLLGDPELIGKVSGLSLKRGWALDENDFTERFVPELKAQPAPKQQAAPAMQIAAPVEEKRYTPPPQPLIGSSEYNNTVRELNPFPTPTLGETFGGAPAVFETREQRRQEEMSPVFKAHNLAFVDNPFSPNPYNAPVAEEQRRAQRQFNKATKEQQQAAITGGTGAELAQQREDEKLTKSQIVGEEANKFLSGVNRAIYKTPSAMVKTAAELGVGVINMLGGDMKSEDAILYNLADKYDKWLDTSEVARDWIGDPSYKGLATDVGSGMGQIVTMLAAGPGGASRTLMSNPTVLKSVAQKMFSKPSLIAGAQVFNSEYENMKAKGENDETAFKQALTNWLATGPLENLPIVNLAERLNKTVGVQATRRILNAIQQGVEEGGQEALQQLFSNFSNNALVELNKNVVDWTEGLQPSAEAGGVVGLLVGALANAKAAKGYSKTSGLNKFSDNVVNNEIIQNAARDYQDNIAKAEQQGRKPDSFNQKQLKKISENPEAWVRDEIKYIQQTIESNKTLGLDSKVEENSLAKATSLLNQIKAEKKGMDEAALAPAQEAVPVAPEAEVIAPEPIAPEPIAPEVTAEEDLAEEVPFEEVPAETEDELAFLDEMRLAPEEEAAILAQEGIIPAEEVAPEVVPAEPATETPQAGSVGVGGDEKFTAKGGNKVVDEKGEPLVVYRSTYSENNLNDGVNYFAEDANYSKEIAAIMNRNGKASNYVEERPIRTIPVNISASRVYELPKGEEMNGNKIKNLLEKDPDFTKKYDAVKGIDLYSDNKIVYAVFDKANIKELKSEQPLKETPKAVVAAAPAPVTTKNVISKPATGKHSSPYKFETFELGANDKRGKSLGHGVYLAKPQESTASNFSNVSLKEGVSNFQDSVNSESEKKGYESYFNNPAVNVLREFGRKIITENGKVVMDVSGDIEQDVRAAAEEYNKKLGPIEKASEAKKKQYATEEDIKNAVEFAKKHQDKLGAAYEYEMEYETDGYIVPDTTSKVATLPKEILNAISSFSPEAKALVDAAAKNNKATFQDLYNNLIGVKGLDSPKGVSDFLDSKGVIGQNDNGQILIYNDKKVNVISRKEVSYAEKGRELKAPVKPAPAAPKKEQAPKPEPKKEEGKPAETKAETEFTSQQSSEAATAFDKTKTSKGFDKKYGKGAYKALSDITKNFEDIMDGMSGKIKQDCL